MMVIQMNDYTDEERRRECSVYVIDGNVFEIVDTVQKLLRDGYIDEQFDVGDNTNVHKTRYVRGNHIVYLIRNDRRTKPYPEQTVLRMGNPPVVEEGDLDESED